MNSLARIFAFADLERRLGVKWSGSNMARTAGSGPVGSRQVSGVDIFAGVFFFGRSGSTRNHRHSRGSLPPPMTAPDEVEISAYAFPKATESDSGQSINLRIATPAGNVPRSLLSSRVPAPARQPESTRCDGQAGHRRACHAIEQGRLARP